MAKINQHATIRIISIFIRSLNKQMVVDFKKITVSSKEEKTGTRRLIRGNSPILEKLRLDERDHRGISINQDGFAIQFRGSSGDSAWLVECLR